VNTSGLPATWPDARAPLLVLVLLMLGASVFAGFPASLLFQAAGQSRPLAWPELLLCAVAGLLAATLTGVCLAPALAHRVTVVLRRLTAPSLALALALGVALRLLLQVLIAPAPASDGAAYLELAQGLLARGEFGNDLVRAYWPPGMAFALAPLLGIAAPAVALGLYTLGCFVLTALGLYRLGRSLGLGVQAAWPVLLLALWPTHALLSGLPEKELLVIALLPWVIWAAREAAQPAGAAARPRWALGMLAGVLLGAIVLIQPSFQLLPPFAAVLALLAGQTLRRVLPVLVMVVLGSAVVVAPWTLRNLAVLGEPVLVSTNGGGNLYRANNELATGGFVAVGRIDVEALPELEANREGKRLAVEWIRSHPLDFAQLTVGRVLLFPGDHSYGAYAAFRADPERVPRPLYLALKAGTAATWLVLWALLIGVAWRHWRLRTPLPPGTGWLLVPWVYLAGIHAFFESGSKYHLPTLALVLLLLVLLLAPTSMRRPP